MLFDVEEGMTLLMVGDKNISRRIFLDGEISKFLVVGWVFSPIPRFSHKCLGGIILGDNPAGHCFALRDLFPISFFKLVMIVLLKIYAAVKIFGKICLKVIRDTFFFQYVVCDQGREGGLG